MENADVGAIRRVVADIERPLSRSGLLVLFRIYLWQHRITDRAEEIVVRPQGPPLAETNGNDIETVRGLLERFLNEAGEPLLLKLP